MAKNTLAPPKANNLDEAVQQAFGLDPAAERSTLLPFYSRRTGWIAPEILYQAAKAAVAPGFAWGGGQVTPEEAMNVAATVGGGGVAASAMKPAPANALGMFIGRRAKTWNQRAYLNAELEERAGVSPEKIWRKWGTWRGPDGEWRQELSDAPMAFQKDLEQRGISKETGYAPLPAEPLPDLLAHPELLQAYPEFANAKMTLHKEADWIPDSAQSGLMTFSPLAKDPKFELSMRYKTEAPALSSTAHELQHAVQHLEGFAQGGLESNFYAAARKTLENDPAFMQLPKEQQQAQVGQVAFNMYQRLMGEAEARATASRRLLTPEQRRATFPAQSYDMPINQLRDSRKK
jgi:hypothetical protein